MSGAIVLTEKQKEYRREATKAYNVKVGATRSGKTYGDYWLLPRRIRAVSGLDGLYMLLGNTKGTLQRNVIEPMQAIWGVENVSSIRSDNTAYLFGEKVHCLGADSIKHVERLRGSSIKYCYGDEVVTWSQDMFDMLKSRLDKPYSLCDLTCNPEGPSHWFKKEIDRGSDDWYVQRYTIDDNPMLDESVRERMKRDYAGSVLYDRYILGLWVAAEGAIYRPWCDNPEKFTRTVDASELSHTVIGVDFGGNGSATAFVCLGILRGFAGVAVLREYYKKGIVTPTEQEAAFVDFAAGCYKDYGTREVRCDNAEQTLIAGFRAAAMRAGLPLQIQNARKGPIVDRIRFALRLMGRGAFWVDAGCSHLREALTSAVYSQNSLIDQRLDDGSTNIDSLDAMEYAFEPYMSAIIGLDGVRTKV